MIPLAVFAALTLMSLFTLSLCRAAGEADEAMIELLDETCPRCGSDLEFDSTGANICTSCGGSWPHHFRTPTEARDGGLR
jgi:predicted amidophosphoribosyltransferase